MMCLIPRLHHRAFIFFFNLPATTAIYTLSLHDALPISSVATATSSFDPAVRRATHASASRTDRKSTRLNSSHITNSYAVFCLKKKNKSSYLQYTCLQTVTQ